MSKTKKLTQISLLAALYASITFATFFMSFGQIQFRISEVLTILPVFTSTAIPGLSIGCIIANLIGFFIGVNPLGWIDAIIGTLATLFAAFSTYYIGRSNNKIIRYIFAPLPAVIFNAIFVGFELTYLFYPLTLEMFAINALFVGIGEAVVCYLLGIPLMIILEHKKLYKKIFY